MPVWACLPQAGSSPTRGTKEGSVCVLLFLGMYYVYAISSLCRNYIYVGLTDNVARQEELFARRTCLSGDMSSADPFIDPLDRCGTFRTM